MKNLYMLLKQRDELVADLKVNTIMLRRNVGKNNVVRQIELMHCRLEIVKSIMHIQGQVIKIYEDHAMENVIPLRKVA